MWVDASSLAMGAVVEIGGSIGKFSGVGGGVGVSGS